MDLGVKFAELLKSTRHALGLSQDQVAEIAGLSRASIANYESGLQGISLEHAVLLASELNFSLDSLKKNNHERLIEVELEGVEPKLKDVILRVLKEDKGKS